jgi:class 3 adenylate cyclase
MAVTGAPVAMPHHQATIVEAGLAFLAAAGEQRIDVRIGAHCGDLVAGMVGVRRFQFDIWGDTVNVAARMETNGEIGMIHVSGAMIPFLEAGFVCIPRGSMAVKGKGTMETWFVEGLKS